MVLHSAYLLYTFIYFTIYLLCTNEARKEFKTITVIGIDVKMRMF